jgi:hypothetical protein
VAQPLHHLTKTSLPENATFPNPLPVDADLAFRTIKAYFANPVNLAVYDPSQPVELYTDASTSARGGTIEQITSPEPGRAPINSRSVWPSLYMHRLSSTACAAPLHSIQV